MKARVESAASGLERYVQDWLTLSKEQAVSADRRGESNDALLGALVTQLAALEGGTAGLVDTVDFQASVIAVLGDEVVALRRWQVAPGTWLGRLVWRILGVHYGSDDSAGGDGGESGSDGDYNGEYG